MYFVLPVYFYLLPVYFNLAMVLQCAEGLIWGGRESQKPLSESEDPGKGQQSPEGQGEEHETSLEAGQTRDQRAGSKLQTASWSQTRGTPSTTGHHPGPEASSQENPAQKAQELRAVPALKETWLIWWCIGRSRWWGHRECWEVIGIYEDSVAFKRFSCAMNLLLWIILQNE